MSDLPRFALAKVALHFLIGFSDPSFKEGISGVPGKPESIR
jgi:hypothetical protein